LRLAKALNVLEADRRLTLLLGLAHFFVAAAHSLFDISATALLIGHVGPDALPQVYLGSAAALIFVGLFVIPFIDRLDRAKLFSLVLAVFALGLVFVAPRAARAPDVTYRLLYIACYLMKGLVFLQFWLLAGDLLDIRQAKRLFPVLLGCSLVGGLAASVSASFLPRWIATETLLSLAGVLLGASLVPVQMVSHSFGNRLRIQRQPAPKLAEVWQDLSGDIDISLNSRLLRTLSVCLLILALLAQVLDFMMGKAAHVQFTTATGDVRLESLTTFYAVLNSAVIGIGTFVQFVATHRVIAALGVTRGQWLMPITFVLGFLATGIAWFAGGGITSSAFFFAVLGARAFQRVLRISLVRTSTDLIFNAIPGERRGRAKAFKETVIEPFGVLLGGAFLMAGTKVPIQYVIAGALVLSFFFLLMTVRLKDAYLDSLVLVLKEKSRFRFAFPSMAMHELAPQEQVPASVSTLRRALGNDEASVRLLAVEVASELKAPEAASLLVARYKEETDPEVRARMMAALGKMVHGQRDTNEVTGLDARAHAQPLATNSDGEEDRFEQRRVFLGLANSGERSAQEKLVHYLEDGDGATRHLAARALESRGEAAIDVLTLALWSCDLEGRRYVIQALSRIGSARARQALLPVLSLEAEEAYYDLVRFDALRRLPEDRSLLLLKDSIYQRVLRAKRNAHHVLRSAFMGEPGMRLILGNLNHPDPYVRSSAIEALDVRVDPTMLGGVLPLFEHENPRVIAEHGSTVYELPSRSPMNVLKDLTRHRSSWIRACALFAVGQVGRHKDLAPVVEHVEDEDALARLNAIEAIGNLGKADNLPVLERLRGAQDPKTRLYAQVAFDRIQKRLASAKATH
jgi:HEAT repeat protein